MKNYRGNIRSIQTFKYKKMGLTWQRFTTSKDTSKNLIYFGRLFRYKEYR